MALRREGKIAHIEFNFGVQQLKEALALGQQMQ